MRTIATAASLALSLLATTALAAPRTLSDAQLDHVVAGATVEDDFTVVGEISDQFTENGNPADPLLVNAWGLAMGPGTFLWVADNGTGVSTLYNPSTFAKVPLNVTIPGPGGAQGTPTGTTFTDFTNDFQVNEPDGMGGTTPVHALFLFDSEDGTISGWGLLSGGKPPPTTAVIAVDESASGAVFKGLTLQTAGVGGSFPELFAANFTGGQVEVFDSNFHFLGAFTDPALPSGYAPFNVQALNGKIYVAFAHIKPGTHDEMDGMGLGFVDVFDTQGDKLATLVQHGQLDAPWGMTIAPPSFGKFAGALLVGNFGNGQINAYDAKTGKFIGTLRTDNEKKLSIDGLWALRVGPDGTVVFSSGPDGENHGLVGVIRPDWAPASWAFQSHVVMGH